MAGLCTPSCRRCHAAQGQASSCRRRPPRSNHVHCLQCRVFSDFSVISPRAGANLNFHPVASPWRQWHWRCQECWSLTHAFQSQTRAASMLRLHQPAALKVRFQKPVITFHGRTCKRTSKLNNCHKNNKLNNGSGNTGRNIDLQLTCNTPATT